MENNFAEKVINISEKLETIILIYDADRQKLDEVRDSLAGEPDGDKIAKRALEFVKNKLSVIITENALNVRFTYTKEDFFTTAPYGELFELRDNPFEYEQAQKLMAAGAKAAGYPGFQKTFKS